MPGHKGEADCTMCSAKKRQVSQKISVYLRCITALNFSIISFVL